MTYPLKELPPQSLTETLAGEALFAGLLGKIFYEYPTLSWILPLVKEDVFAEAPLGAAQAEIQRGMQILQQWSTEINLDGPQEWFEMLRADYTRLFIGPGKVIVPPWESVYFNEDRMIFQSQTLQVRDWYLRFGLVSEKLYNEPDDHIGLELAFVSHLAGLALQALHEKNLSRVSNLLDAQRDFLSSHLFLWAPKFTEQVIEHARAGFYQGAALLLQGSLLEIGRWMDLRVAEKVS